MSPVERLTSWEQWGRPYESLPLDLTPNSDVPVCDETWQGRYWCTRRIGHTGRHAAGTGERIVAVWASKDQRDSEVTS